MLVLIRGLPGSGKSTLAKQMCALDPTFVHVEADMYFVNDEGSYLFDARSLSDAHEWCQETVNTALAAGKNVVVSNTFVKKWEVEPYLRMASWYGSEVEIIVATGEYVSTHFVPEALMARMRANWETF